MIMYQRILKRVEIRKKSKYPDLMMKRSPSGDALDADFTMYELKMALGGVNIHLLEKMIYVM